MIADEWKTVSSYTITHEALREQDFDHFSAMRKGSEALRVAVIKAQRTKVYRFRCGHPMDEENTRIRSNGYTICRTCDKAQKRKAWAANPVQTSRKEPCAHEGCTTMRDPRAKYGMCKAHFGANQAALLRGEM